MVSDFMPTIRAETTTRVLIDLSDAVIEWADSLAVNQTRFEDAAMNRSAARMVQSLVVVIRGFTGLS